MLSPVESTSGQASDQQPLGRGRRSGDIDAQTRAALALLNVLALRDIETACHCERVRAYASHLTTLIAPQLFDDPTLEIGFLLHDIGKLALPDAILQKPGPLTASEQTRMRTHTSIGVEIASRFLSDGAGINVIRAHHERWDGTGYPNQTSGRDIPNEARIFAVADALDALTSDRPYRHATKWDEAVELLAADTGSHFDPVAIDALKDHAHELRTINDRLSGRTAANSQTLRLLMRSSNT
jgi:putative nucleotidyltransferase with HDIG domain